MRANATEYRRGLCLIEASQWDVASCLAPIGTKTGIIEYLDEMVNAIVAMSKPDDQIVVMSNGGFGGVHGKILARLAEREMGSK